MKILGKAGLRVFLLAWALIVIYPLVWMVISSFKTTNEIFLSTWSLPEALRFDNYALAWNDYEIGRSFFNTLLVTVLATVFNLLLAVPSAYAIERVQFRGSQVLLNTYLAAMMIPACMGWIPLFFLLNHTGLTNSLVILALIYAVGKLPFSIFILGSFMSSVPRDLEEAAAIDGMSQYGILFKIVTPLIRSGIITVCVMNVITFWSEYFMALLFVPDKAKTTLGVIMRQLSKNAQYQNQWGASFAGLVISTIPVIVIYAVLNKHVVKGMVEGALKG